MNCEEPKIEGTGRRRKTKESEVTDLRLSPIILIVVAGINGKTPYLCMR